ncbi:MAG TPA: hypothetical protein VFB15_13055 [Candidatus Binataceae bacterium]|nr:hypothetical protein [Candidatus Binataceae bacterium]
MLRRCAIQLALITLLGFSSGYPAYAQSSPAAPRTVGSASEVVVRGKIVGVDRANKVVTIAGPEGHTIALRVTDPYNLKAAKVGDPVVAHFYEIVTIRKKKPGETIPSASLKEGIVGAGPGQVPGGAVGQQLELLVKVVAIDKPNDTVTLQGPDGNTETVKARNPENLKLIKPGDELVVKLTRAVVIRIDRA